MLKRVLECFGSEATQLSEHPIWCSCSSGHREEWAGSKGPVPGTAQVQSLGKDKVDGNRNPIVTPGSESVAFQNVL